MEPLGVFAGLACWDLTYVGPGGLPRENEKVRCAGYTLAPGGPAANAALTYAALGGPAVLVCAVGNSPLGLALKQQLTQAGITVHDLRPDDALPDIATVYVDLANGSRTVFSGQREKPRPDTGELSAYFSPAAFIEFDGNLPYLEEALTGCGKPLVLDLGSDKESFGKLFGHPGITAISSSTFTHQGQDVFRLDERYHFAFAARTNGDQPVEARVNGAIVQAAVPAVKTVDTLGAGDVLHGAYCYYRFMEQADEWTALRQAAAFASYSTAAAGVAAGIAYARKECGGD
jgi:sugar/nucleoside kinase (ribokinase family)